MGGGQEVKNALKSLFVKIDNCRPAFEWMEYRHADKLTDTYEIAVHTAIDGRSASLPLGEQVFSKEGIVELRAVVEADLRPNTNYFWSIRLKHADGSVTNWLTHFASKYIFVGNIEYSHIWPGFKTPKLCNK